MSIAWNHSWAAGDDLFDHVTLSIWHHAFRQRFGNPGGIFGTVVAGDDVSSVAFWRNMQFDGAYTYFNYDGGFGGRFVPYADYTGTAVFFGGGALGIPDINWAYVRDTVLGGSGYPRRYPKEFGNLVSTTYQDGSAFVNGDNAKNLATGLVYTRTAGVWVRAVTGVFADSVLAYGGDIQDPTTRLYHPTLPGDYLGLSEPINDAANLLITVFGPSALWIADGTVNYYDGDSGASTLQISWASSQAEQAANYAVPNISDTQDGNAPFALSYGEYALSVAPNFYYGYLSRRMAKVEIADDANGLASDIDVYIETIAPNLLPGDVDTSPAGPVFDANGDAVLNGALSKFDSLVGVGAGGTLKTAFLGSLSQPNFCPQPVDPTPYNPSLDREIRMQGYLAAPNPIAIFNFGVAGGFDERP